MEETFEDADAKTVGMYAQLALSFPLAKGQDLIDSLTSLYPVITNLRLRLGVGGRGTRKRGATYLTGEGRQDVLDALRKAYAVYDRLLLSNLIAEEQKQPFKQERARLSAFIQKQVVGDNMRKIRDMETNTAQSEEEFDEHSYLSEDKGSEDAGHEPVTQRTDEPPAWRTNDSKERRGTWRTRDPKPHSERKP
jgi:hypothetical protein